MIFCEDTKEVVWLCYVIHTLFPFVIKEVRQAGRGEWCTIGTKRTRGGGERTRNGEEGVSAAATASAAIRYSDTADASGRRPRWRRQSAFSILRASTGPTTTGRGFPWKRRITTEAWDVRIARVLKSQAHVSKHISFMRVHYGACAQSW